jgi:hypothetical protein
MRGSAAVSHVQCTIALVRSSTTAPHHAIVGLHKLDDTTSSNTNRSSDRCTLEAPSLQHHASPTVTMLVL